MLLIALLDKVCQFQKRNHLFLNSSLNVLVGQVLVIVEFQVVCRNITLLVKYGRVKEPKNFFQLIQAAKTT